MIKTNSAIFDIAVVGASGLVGETMLKILRERNFPVGRLYPVASHRSAGDTLEFGRRSLYIENLEDFDFSQVQMALFAVGGDLAEIYVPKAAELGCIVIDNSSAFRYDDAVPLIVPEVNLSALSQYRHKNIIANPNCSTAQMVLALKPIYDAVGISRLTVSTYQSVSGAGKAAIEELADQTRALITGQPIAPKIFPKQIAFNVIPEIDVFNDEGYTREEMKMVWETHKILDDPTIIVNPTAVRVPVFYGHSEALSIQTKKAITVVEAQQLLREAAGIRLFTENEYPTAATDSAHQDEVCVGRIRPLLGNLPGLQMWVVGDNIRKGAALNAVQIAEHLVSNSR